MSTIYDVAAEAGVSIATVSRVLNGKDHISDKTRDKVMSAVRKLSYAPTAAAQVLSGARSKNILVILSMHTSHSPACIRGIDAVARSRGYNLILSYHEPMDSPRVSISEMFGSLMVSGLIYQSFTPGIRIELPEPTVVISEVPEPDHPYSVVSNDRKGVSELVRSLIARGRKRFAYVSATPQNLITYSYFTEERLQGLKDALLEAGLDYDPQLTYRFVPHDYNNRSIRENAARFVQIISAMPAGKRPDTVICASDAMAAAIINCLTEAGIRVPEDVCVTGFDNNTDICESAYIPITTVEAPYEEIGRQAASLLLELIDGKEPEKAHLNIDPGIIYRASTGDAD